MRFINLYLIGFVVFVLGLGLALWKTGVLGHLSPAWIAIGTVVVIGLGIMFAVGAGKPAITRE